MTQPASRPLIPVACGVLLNTAGEVLIAERPPGRIAAGKWEFPGGKIEPGETAQAALRRELNEELGIEVLEAQPLLRLRQDYSDRSVWLDTWLVTAYDGQLRGREKQRLAWARPDALAAYDLLPSCWRVIAALCLPRHYVFTPPAASVAFLLEHLPDLPAGCLLRLRLPQAADEQYQAAARLLAPACGERGIRLILDRDPALVEQLDAAGWHASSSRLRQLDARPLPHGRWMLASAHDAQELALARSLGADAAVLAPVLASASHPGAGFLGWTGAARLAAEAGLPVFALGGLGPDDLDQALARGVFGVAGISAYWSS
jgi:8-oxo-dGTP diphosphatase